MKKKKGLTFEEKLIIETFAELQAQQVQPVDILREALPYQLDFITSPSLRKAVCSERRAGKSFALALALINKCLTVPKSNCAYFGLTNQSCEDIMWRDILETIIYKYQLPAKLLSSKHTIQFDNGSIILLQGLDASPEQKNKARGKVFDIVVIDEAQDFTQDLEEIIKVVLKMALAQRQAQLILAGTPGDKQGLHYWWQINKPDTTQKEWQLFKFHWTDNTKLDAKSNMRVCDAIQRDVDLSIAQDPLIIHTPAFRQEVLGEWIIETSSRIYRYEPLANDINTLPPVHWLRSASYILGFDIGYAPDPTALVVCAYNPKQDGYYYVLQSEIHPKMITEQLQARIKFLDQQYHFQFMVGDCANLNIIEDLRQTYHLPLIRADKLGKEAHQNMLNSDFITQRIKIFTPGCPGLSEQLQTVIWDKRTLLATGKRVEDPSFHNDQTDSLLYSHHFSRHHWFKPLVATVYQAPTNEQRYNTLSNQLISRNKPKGLHGIDFAEPNRN